MLRRPGIVVLVVLLLSSGCASGGSSSAGGASSGSGSDTPVLTLAATCPGLQKALAAGTRTPFELRSLAEAVDALADSADLDTRRALTALPADARVLARSPGAPQAKAAFRADVALLDQTCQGAGSPIS